MKVGDNLKTIVDQNLNRIRKENPFISGAKRGSLDKGIIERYLNNLWCVMQNTPIQMKLASEISLSRGDQDLSKFYFEKIKEEEFHWMWAKDDLAKIDIHQEKFNPALINPATEDFLSYARELTEKDPALYMSYMFLLEYFTVVAGPEFISDLEKNCGISRDKMTAVVNHQELDKEHVAEDIELIDGYVKDEKHAQEFQDALIKCLSLLERIFAECVYEERRHESDLRTSAEAVQ